jgi:hypothetical protein
MVRFNLAPFMGRGGGEADGEGTALFAPDWSHGGLRVGGGLG